MNATRRTACPRCKKPIAVPGGATRVRCPHCQAALVVPVPKPTDPPTIDVKSDLVDSASESPTDDAEPSFLQPPKSADEIGRLGKFRILRELGRGGMGMVFLAEDSLLERKVALKVMLPEHAARGTARTRFLQEARTAAKIDHDHVVAILEIGEDGGVPYLTMPLLQGESLADLLKRERKLPLEDVLRIGAEVARGLSAAHERGLVHRDLKPGNTWLEKRSGSHRAKILDFGLARAVEGDVQLTGSGQLLGTPAYMSPEQARSPKVDHRSDLFSLGVMLYQMATGQLPFSGHDAMSVLLAITTEAPPTPRELDPTLPDTFEALLMRLLEKKPDQRPASASDVAREMEEMRLAWYPPTGTLGGSLTAGPSAFAFDETSAVVSAPAVASPTKTPSSTKGPSSPVAPKGTKPPPKPVWPWLAGVAALIVTVIVGAQIVIRITDEKGKVREIPLAPGEKVEIVQKPVKPVVPKPPEPKAPVSPTTPLVGFDPDNPAWQKAFEALPTDEQTKRVEAELRKKNPQFDGTIKFGAKDGKVTSIAIGRGYSLGDIGPVRALRRLSYFAYHGARSTYVDRGALSDLSPLRGLPIRSLLLEQSTVADLTPLRGVRIDGFLSIIPHEIETIPDILSPENVFMLRVSPKDRDYSNAMKTKRFDMLFLDGANTELDLDFFKNCSIGSVTFGPVTTQSNLDALSRIQAREMVFTPTEKIVAAMRKNKHVRTISETKKETWLLHYEMKPVGVSAWRKLGPFALADDAPFDPQANQGVISAEDFRRKQGAAGIEWTQPYSLDNLGTASLDRSSRDATNGPKVNWYYATIDAKSEEDAIVFLSGYASRKLWWNGVPVLNETSGHFYGSPITWAAVRTRPGVNTVCLRAEDAPTYGWQGWVQIAIGAKAPAKAP